MMMKMNLLLLMVLLNGFVELECSKQQALLHDGNDGFGSAQSKLIIEEKGRQVDKRKDVGFETPMFVG